MNERKLFQIQRNIKKKNIRICRKIKDSKRNIFQKNNNGITLIALVISIIVMLILAGVSLNAVIGDNGIITNAQNATYMQSVAVLEEYLNSYYIGHYEGMQKNENKVIELQNYSESSNWIYSPRKNGYGACDYVVDENGKAYYLINKSALPEDIKNELRGGDTEGKTYREYTLLEDVYGVTSDLKVYYCKNEDEIIGISKEELDLDNPLRVVFDENSKWANLINGGESVTAENIKSINKLSLTGDISEADLKELYNFVSLKELTIKDANIQSLSGIENATRLTDIIVENSTIADYSGLSKLSNIEYIKLDKVASSQVEILFTQNAGAIWKNLNKIEISNCSNLQNIECMDLLANESKISLKELDFSNNNLFSLNGIQNYTNIKEIRVDSNRNLTSLKELANMNNLVNVFAQSCNLGANEVYNTSLENNGKNENEDALVSLVGKNLKNLYLNGNVNLKWISYIKDIKNLTYLELSNCNNIVNEDMALIKEVVLSIPEGRKKIPTKYLSLFNTSNRLNYTGTELKDDSIEIAGLINNKDVEYLSLYGSRELSNSKLNEVLSTTPNIKCLQLYGLTNLTSIDFIRNMPNLVELDLRGTSVTDLSLLESLTEQNKISVKTLVLDNENIQLNTIQKTISNCNQSSQNGFLDDWLRGGILLLKSSLLRQLNTCTEITNFACNGYVGLLDLKGEVFDLSACTNLKTIYLGYPTFSVIVPSNCIKYEQNATRYVPDLSNAVNLANLSLSITNMPQEDFDKLFENAQNLNNLKTIHISSYSSSGRPMFSSLESLNNFSENNVVSSFTLGIYDSNYFNLKSLSGIEKLRNLTKLSMRKTGINSLNGLEGLTKLNSIEITESSITDISALENLKNLSTLNLSNNCLYDDFYKEINGERVNYNTFEILKRLNKNGNLQKINLSNNTGLVNKDSLTEDGAKWSEDSIW